MRSALLALCLTTSALAITGTDIQTAVYNHGNTAQCEALDVFLLTHDVSDLPTWGGVGARQTGQTSLSYKLMLNNLRASGWLVLCEQVYVVSVTLLDDFRAEFAFSGPIDRTDEVGVECGLVVGDQEAMSESMSASGSHSVIVIYGNPIEGATAWSVTHLPAGVEAADGWIVEGQSGSVE